MTQEDRSKIAALISEMEEIKGKINALQLSTELLLKDSKPEFYYGKLPGYAYE